MIKIYLLGENVNLLEQIVQGNEEDIDDIITKVIEEANSNAEKVEKLGYVGKGFVNNAHKGFIPLDTRIKYSNWGMEDYSMQSTDFIYEFAHFIKKYNITTKGGVVNGLESFINMYFGMPGKESRETIFDTIAWQTTNTDEEYFAALENNKIGDLKGKGAAECTERAAVAQQLLNMFGIETYYCMGCLDNNNQQEGHCFNVAKRKDGYAVLDYSCPVTSFDKDGKVKGFTPFVGLLSDEEFEQFIKTGKIKSFNNYEYDDNKRVTLNSKRMYVVGDYEIDKNKVNTEEKDNKKVIEDK